MQLHHPFNRNSWCSLGAIALVAFLSACGGAVDPTSPLDPPEDDTRAEGDCSTPDHLTLTDIESVTDWINALPIPLELPCFIESLPRPLYVNMTESVFSAQPSNGKGNPRVFIFLDRLMLSVVPQEAFPINSTAPQHNLLEISFNTEGIQSIKAEIPFPVKAPLVYGDAYSTLIFDNLVTTSCGVCHGDEIQVGDFDGVPVFQSQMLRPYYDFEVSIGLIKNEAFYCNAINEPHRCAMLNALVGDGDFYWQEFAPDIPIL